MREATVAPIAATTVRPRSVTWATPTVAALLFASGAAGLVYQVAWVRLLGLTFGVTLYAISTVLAAFMGGLAIGSLVGGRHADKVKNPLRLYGLVELGVGLTALATPTAFRVLQDVYAATGQAVDQPLLAGTLRAILAFTVLLVPTALMGATLPMAVRGIRQERYATRADAWAMGVLYATNTAGAIVGCLISGFVLIGRIGLEETIVAAACANVFAGIGGLALSSRGGSTLPVPHRNASTELLRRTRAERRTARAALIAFSLSGAVSLAYEVVWSRILAVLFDASIYGFVLMLATVLAGIALGGALGGVFVRRYSTQRSASMAFAVLEVGIGVAAVLALAAFGTAYTGLTLLREGGPSLLTRLVRTDLRLMATLCVLTVGPAALLMALPSTS